MLYSIKNILLVLKAKLYNPPNVFKTNELITLKPYENHLSKEYFIDENSQRSNQS